MVCPELRWAFEGIDRADSLVINAHKWMFTPMDCSLLWTSRPDEFRDAFSLVPEFLRTTDEGVLNLSEYGPALGRRFRSLKLWAVLRCYGAEGCARRIREAIRLAELFEGWVRTEPGWELCAPRPFSLVCFRRDGTDEENEAILERVNASGEIFISHTKLDGRYVLRLAIGSDRTTEDDVRRAWDVLGLRDLGKRTIIDRVDRDQRERVDPEPEERALRPRDHGGGRDRRSSAGPAPPSQTSEPRCGDDHRSAGEEVGEQEQSVSWNEFPPKMSPIASWWSPRRTAAMPLEISGRAVAAARTVAPKTAPCRPQRPVGEDVARRLQRDARAERDRGREAEDRGDKRRRTVRERPPFLWVRLAPVPPSRSAPRHLDLPVAVRSRTRLTTNRPPSQKSDDRDRGRADTADAGRRRQRCTAENGGEARR